MKIPSFIRIAFFALLIFTTTQSLGQEAAPDRFSKKDFMVSYGNGYPSPVRFAINRLVKSNNELSASGIGPNFLKLEYGISKKFSVALNATYSYSDIYWTQDARNPSTGLFEPYRHGVDLWEVSAGLRANYYFLKKKNWLMYGGLGAGAGHIELESYVNAPKERLYTEIKFPITWTFEGTVGARYFVAKNIALYSEVGIGQSWLLYNLYYIPAAIGQLGFSIKF